MSKVRMGMVGGGEGAFIGAVHRIAAAIDGEIELVCGNFSSTEAKSKRSGAALYLPESRVYGSYQDMFAAEAALPEDQRMQFVAIVTPNHLHFPVAQAALEAGFHVLSDKPATLSLAEAKTLQGIVEQTGRLYGLTHTYTGYPLVKEARQRVANGELGAIRKVIVEYPQGWLADADSEQDNKQAEWRLDPSKSGVSNCMGDIGVHAANLAEYVSGIQIESVCADLSSFIEGRRLDDDGSILLRFNNGAKGVLMASQISVGEENGLRLRVYGEKGGLEWSQQEPNSLLMKWADQPMQVLRTGMPYLGELAAANTRTPSGHPEGYLEAFANIYRAFAEQVRAFDAGQDLPDGFETSPGIQEALRGMAFIELAVSASNSDVKWHPFPALVV